MSARATMADMRALARLWNVQVSFEDVFGQRRNAGPDALIPVLRALGAPVERMEDVPEAVRARRRDVWARALEPVTVSWEGQKAHTLLRLPTSIADARGELSLEMEDGTEHVSPVDFGGLHPVEKDDEDGGHVAKRLPLPRDLPLGYHRVRVRARGLESESMLVRAPVRAAQPEDRGWGVFMPLYALRSARSWGIGDLGDLADLVEWVGTLGGGLVATLPLLATFLDEPFEPSPYSPVSRLFWNEAFVDVEALPGLAGNVEARARLESADFRSQLERLRSEPLVDYAAVARLKRSVMEPLARAAPGRADPPADDDDELERYALFRGAHAARGPWPEWDSPAETGPSDHDEVAYHRFVQRAARDQLARIDELRAALLFDLPLGVHPLGYDAWRYRASFADGVAGGAPPDTFFPSGQNWGFAPLHPERIRESGYEYPRACFRNLMRHARVVRIDHVMGLHRLWWVPEGLSAERGAYVRYDADELFAILALESHRSGTIVVGEDLGTVPREVRRAMGAHGVLRSYVVQEELTPDPPKAMNPIPTGSIASPNTHDMPPFASFWRGLDVDQRLSLGVLDHSQARSERERRRRLTASLTSALVARRLVPENPDAPAVLRAVVRLLASSSAHLVVVALEDLWGETEPQNVPGTGESRSNWRRVGRYDLDALRELPEVVEVLRDMDRRRRG